MSGGASVCVREKACKRHAHGMRERHLSFSPYLVILK